MQSFSFHCHTVFSDGNNTVEEMILAAKNAGFTHLGISDHLIVPKITDFSEKIASCQQHVQHIRSASEKFNFPVYVGFETDYFPQDGWDEALLIFKETVKADYLLTGNHFVSGEDGEYYPILKFPWKGISEKEANKIISKHFQNISQAVRSGLFDFLAHPDFIRWSSPCGETDFVAERMDIIEALSETHLPVELNTKGLRKIGDFYPANWMLKEIAKRKIPMLISDDAHDVTDVGSYFELAERRLSETDNVVRVDLATKIDEASCKKKPYYVFNLNNECFNP